MTESAVKRIEKADAKKVDSGIKTDQFPRRAKRALDKK